MNTGIKKDRQDKEQGEDLTLNIYGIASCLFFNMLFLNYSNFIT